VSRWWMRVSIFSRCATVVKARPVFSCLNREVARMMCFIACRVIVPAAHANSREWAKSDPQR
jgi:hypothetical protein